MSIQVLRALSSDEKQDFYPYAHFDEWIISLSRYDRKILSVLQHRKLLHITPTLESAYIVGFKEKTVRKCHDKFLEYKGKFVDEERGKYKMHC